LVAREALKNLIKLPRLNMPDAIPLRHYHFYEVFLRNDGFGGRDAFLPSVPSLTGWRLTPPMPSPSRRHSTPPSFRAERGISHLSAKSLLPLCGKNGGRFLRCARSCLARSGRNDGWGGGAMRGGGGSRTARTPLRRRRHSERSEESPTLPPTLVAAIWQKWREVPPLRALVPRALRSE
jgi:hypothetical protein